MASDVQALADRFEIMDVKSRYGRALDTRDWDLMRTVFTDDAEADFWAGGKHKGIEPILTACSAFMETLDATHHLFANHEIQVEGDCATGRVSLYAGHFLPAAPGGDPNFNVRGFYEEEYVRTSEGWRISKLKLNPLWSDGNIGVCEAGNVALAEAFAT